ncbi:MAG: hypothetical protein Kow0029_27780 [Candidatus Rifleibacteriota bacterium]
MNFRINTLVLFFVTIALAVLAQPAEFSQIQQLVQPPDELISTEFTSAGQTTIYSVELTSEKLLKEIENMFNSINLNLVSVEKFSDGTFKLILTNADSEKLNTQKFDEITSLAWQTGSDSPNVLSLNTEKIELTTDSRLAQNSSLAKTLNMQPVFIDNDEHKIIYCLNLKDRPKVVLQPQSIENDELAQQISNYFRIIAKSRKDGKNEYKLEGPLNQLTKLISLPGKSNKAIKFVSAITVNGSTVSLILTVAETEPGQQEIDRINILARVLDSDTFAWPSDAKLNAPVLTGFETDFGNKITLTGISPKSSMIFTQFFSQIQKIGGLYYPFFSRGTYQDTEDGRVMHFKIQCDW